MLQESRIVCRKKGKSEASRQEERDRERERGGGQQQPMSVIVRSWMLLKVHHILLHFKEFHKYHLDFVHRRQAICLNEYRICAFCRRRRRSLFVCSI